MPRTIPKARTLIVGSLLTCHAAMLAWIGYVHAPMYDEIAHLPSGISHWEKGNFDLYRVNPPLPRMVAAIPVILASPITDWSDVSTASHARPEFPVGKRFAERNGLRTPWLFTLARWACIGFSLLGGWICYRWASELFGFGSGLVALTLWCFCPNILAWGGTITPDIAAAGVGVAAGYFFWLWLRKPGWLAAGAAGLVMGLAELTKSSWILLFVLWPCLWLITRVVTRPPAASSMRWQEAAQLVTILLLAVYSLNMGYLFEDSFRPLNEYEFNSAALGGQPDRRLTGNRFRDTLVGMLPVPLPANYVRGIDVQKFDFEVGKWSYLRGEQKRGGWYYYYVYALAIKTPLGTLGLAALAICLWASSAAYRATWRDEIVPLAMAIAVLALVSSQDGFNRYLRYVVPALPFLFISISRVGRTMGAPRVAVQVVAVALIGLTIVGSLRVFPHSMSFFNLLAGGPLGGPAHLLDANIDWGQDLLHLKKWMERHPQAQPLRLQYFGFLEPSVVGLKTLKVPKLTKSHVQPSDGPQPGWYAISVNDLFGYRHYGHPREQFAYLQQFQPVDRVGYSIYIYNLSLDDANRTRRDHGLPELPAESVAK